MTQAHSSLVYPGHPVLLVYLGHPVLLVYPVLPAPHSLRHPAVYKQTSRLLTPMRAPGGGR